MRRLIEVLWRPRATMTAVVNRPAFVTAWISVLAVVAVCAAVLLPTPLGRQALVDERVRVVEALGGQIDDGAYAALQANPPWLMYLTSGGRILLTPLVTVLVAAGLVVLASLDGVRVRYVVALAVTVHASAALAVQQLVATPLHFVRESLTSPFSLSGLAPMLQEGSLPARWLGALDVFGLWWVWLLAVGLSAAAGRPAWRYLVRLLVAYVGVAAIVAAVFAVFGAE